jgi:signal transduction histidine kinase/ligand-binding sensor domain-containing protein
MFRQGSHWLKTMASTGLACAFCTCASGADAPPPGYLIDVWDIEDGLPNSKVTAVAQTPDGYLWVGTYDGLARFDGMRFVTFDPGNTPELRHARVQALYVDTSGTLWIDTFRGSMTSYRDGAFHAEGTGQSGFDLHTTLVWSSPQEEVFVGQFGDVLRRTHTRGNPAWTAKAPPVGSRPIFQCADKDGTLWFLNREGRIVRFLKDHFEDLPASASLSNRVLTLAMDEQGRIWAGAQNEIARWRGDSFEDMTPTNGERVFDPSLVFPTRSGALWVLTGDRLRKQIGRQWVAEAVEWRGLLGRSAGRAMGAHEDRDGGVWFNHYGNGLFHIAPDGRLERFTTKNGLTGDRVAAWYQGREGGVWLGIDRGGLTRLRDRRFQVIGLSEGLPVRAALSVCQSRDGAVWIGTAGGGLCRWTEGTMTRFAVGNSVAADFIFSMFPRPDGGLWLSARDEDMFEFKDGTIFPLPWVEHGVKSLLTDRSGRLWIGSKSGLSWWTPAARRTFGTADGMTPMAIRALAEAPDGAVWCGADDGTLYRCGLDRLQAFHANDALAGQAIGSLLADEKGVIWAGTFRGGLLRFANGQFQRFTAKQGLYADVIGQILQDNQQRLWLGTHRGIICVPKTALNACAEGKAKTVDCVTYGRLDGLPTLEFADGYQPACWRGNDGRLWFATVRGVVSVNPEALTARALPPPVVVEEVLLDGERLALNAGKLVIPPGHKQFEFRFTALSFDAPDKTRFRYRIDGLDNDWVDADTRRTADYGNLPPNNYRFRVIACAGDGRWNEAGAALAFTVEPHFYQTWWFLALASISILGGGAGMARLAATRKYRRDLSLLQQQHAVERDRARIAQDIHDDLGAGLTQITLLGELARREPGDAGAHLDRISRAARQLTRAMDEIVWAVDPQHDTLNGLMDYISAFAEDFLRVAGIHCRMDLPAALPQRRVDAELRYNLFLAVKEALNNVVKHAEATEVWLRLRVEERGFTLIVEDNGRGCNGHGNGNGAAAKAGAFQDRLATGSGLPNLQKRLHAIGGRCTVFSVPGEGMRIEMAIPVNVPLSPVVAIGQNGGSR